MYLVASWKRKKKWRNVAKESFHSLLKNYCCNSQQTMPMHLYSTPSHHRS